MTILPSQFGYEVDHYDLGKMEIILPCIEAPAKWCDGEPPSENYHRHRARALVNVAATDTLFLWYHLDNTAAQNWDEAHTNIANDWTSSFADANETQDHPYASEAVPNSTPEDKSHRYVVARIRFAENPGNIGDPIIRGWEFGWPHDDSIAAGDPTLELGDRTGAHSFDAYHSASAWHISRCLLGTLNRLMYEARFRIGMSMANQR